MRMPWASDTGVSQAIPPAYTQFIGEQLIGLGLVRGPRFVEKNGGRKTAHAARASTAHGGPSVGNLGAACRAHVVHTVPQGRSTVPAGGVGHAGSRA